MATQVSQVTVRTAAEIDTVIGSYIAQGFIVQNRGEDFVLLFKKKEFNVIWAVVGFFLCALPLIIYLIVYAMESDQMVEIRVGTMGVTYSEDGNYYWDTAHNQWLPVAGFTPPEREGAPEPAAIPEPEATPESETGEQPESVS